MRLYSPNTNKGRTVGCDDVHHKTADQPKRAAQAAAKALRHAARQEGKLACGEDGAGRSRETSDAATQLNQAEGEVPCQ